MHEFRLWAPNARTIEVLVGEQTIPLRRLDRGWWSAETGAGPGADYAFLVDGGGPPLPDPRSAWQPYGVHGPSRLIDHAAFPWSDSSWQAPALEDAVLYELHLGTFTPEGNLAGAEDRLDYLKNLGVTHVELMPIATFAGNRGWGYDGVDLYAPHPAYGSPDALKHFVDACHRKGLAVLLDVVYNHLGPVGNYLAKFGPYFTPNHSTPWGPAVNLEGADSDEVRRFFIDNALMWLADYHMDGLRLDAVHAFIDRSAVHFLEQLAREVAVLGAKLGRNLALIAESDLNDPRLVKAAELGGFGLDAQWSDDFHHALFAALTGERQGYYSDFGSLAALAASLEEVFVYRGGYSAHRRRHHGRPAQGVPRSRFLGYIQNHDQVGNRAHGERIAHLVGPGRAKIAAALVLTAPFVPLIFQGEEFAASAPFQYFTDYEDPEMGRAVSEGRKKEFAAFGWDPERIPDPQAESTFCACRLDWTEVDRPPHSSLLQWYKALIRLRRSLRDLSAGRAGVRFDEDAGWLVLHRGRVRVACNFSARPQTVEVGEAREILLQSDAAIRLAGAQAHLPADSVAVIV